MGWKAFAEWLTDVGECRSAAGRSLVAERFSAYQRQIPLIYTVTVTNLLGMYVATGGTADSLLHPIPLLVCFVVVRLIQLHRLRHRKLKPREELAELRKSWWLALLISGAFGVWALHHLSSHAADQTIIVLFASLAAIGCSYAMASLPAAARLPLWILFTAGDRHTHANGK